MEPRTFRAPTTQSALEMIQEELGSEAIIVSVREIPAGPAWQTWKKPEVEVLAIPSQNNGSDQIANDVSDFPIVKEDNNYPLSPKSPRDYRTKKNTTKSISRTELEIAIAQLAGRRQSIPARKTEPERLVAKDLESTRPQTNKDRIEATVPNTLVNARKQLIDQGLDKQLVSKLITACGNAQSFYALEDANRVATHIKHQMEAYIRVLNNDPATYASQAEKIVVCMIGLSGSGKTSTLAKLAAFYMKNLDKKVTWISSDTIRTGAISLAQTYTQSLNIPLTLAYTPEDLEQAIQAENQAEIILLDTSARNPYNEHDVVELGSFLTTIPKKVVYMTAPATAKEKDLHEAWVSYSPFEIDGFVVTKLDETNYFGDIGNLAWQTQTPLAYFTYGTKILNNLMTANAKKYAGLLLGERITG